MLCHTCWWIYFFLFRFLNIWMICLFLASHCGPCAFWWFIARNIPCTYGEKEYFQSFFSNGHFSTEVGNVSLAPFLELFEVMKKNIQTNYMAQKKGSTCLCDVLIMFLFFCPMGKRLSNLFNHQWQSLLMFWTLSIFHSNSTLEAHWTGKNFVHMHAQQICLFFWWFVR